MPSKTLVSIVLLTAVLVTSALVFAVTLALIWLKTGRSFESILSERGQLFRRSLMIAIVLLIVAAMALIIRNNA